MKKVKYIPATYDEWIEVYVKEYVSGPYKNKPSVDLLPNSVYTYIKEKNIISDTLRFQRKDAKTQED
jgi:hypothetical protein